MKYLSSEVKRVQNTEYNVRINTAVRKEVTEWIGFYYCNLSNGSNRSELIRYSFVVIGITPTLNGSDHRWVRIEQYLKGLWDVMKSILRVFV